MLVDLLGKLSRIVSIRKEARDCREAAQRLLEQAGKLDREAQRLQAEVEPEVGRVMTAHLIDGALGVLPEDELTVSVRRVSKSDTLLNSILELGSRHSTLPYFGREESFQSEKDYRPFRDLRR